MSEQIPIGTHYGAKTLTLPDRDYSLGKIVDAGTILRISCRSDHDEIEFRFNVDGKRLHHQSFLHGAISAGGLNTLGFTSESPQIQLLRHGAGEATNDFSITIPFNFERSFETFAFHDLELENLTAGVSIIYLREKIAEVDVQLPEVTKKPWWWPF